MINPEDVLFPHDEVRPIQEELIKDIDAALATGKNIIAHAPTGLGKTASSLPVAFAHALKNDLTVFFLTSRHTQHEIAIQTLKEVRKKYNLDFTSVDLIGKQWMCPVPGVKELYSSEFSEYCKTVREDEKCEFYTNTKKKNAPTIKTKKLLGNLKQKGILDSEEMIKMCSEDKLCPYEVSMLAAKNANVIIADYYYIFHDKIRDTFFQKAGKELEKCIIIVDEAHNLPKRVTDLLTNKISTYILGSAIKEANKFSLEERKEYLEKIQTVLDSLADEIDFQTPEKTVTKEDFFNKVKDIHDYKELIEIFDSSADMVMETQKRSVMGSVASFLESWTGEDDAFARVLSIKETRTSPTLTLTYKCLDPSIATKDVIEKSYSTILMSGTLTPTVMYKDLLGFDDKMTMEKEYPSPFPDENKLNLIIPETTTKYTARGQEMYKRIGEICAEICNEVPGNSAIFFPSYYLRDEVLKFFETKTTKTIFPEHSGLSREEKQTFLKKFESYKETGAVLLGVASGSFSQGVDFKGDMLKAVIVVGIPLNKPDLETNKLIEYYDEQYIHVLDYAYFFPAITKCVQAAGRCIRSETDKGVIIFLDERFAWPSYKKFFPTDWDIKISRSYKEYVQQFFNA